jgi:alpha-ketoglutarate-dependent taurine dioxygenase
MPGSARDARAWTAATLDPADRWYVPLPDDCLRTFDAHIDQARRERRPLIEIRLSPQERDDCRQRLAPVLHTLEAGRGFVILCGIPPQRHSPEDLRTAYWLVGQALGEPFAQNVQGTLLYDVRDTGGALAEGARFSITSYESTFHTDNSFGESTLDYVGLLCLQGARSGGLSQLVSGFAVYRELRHRHPEALAVLAQPFHVDRRGGTRPGEPPTASYPVIGSDGHDLTFRYLRAWIEAGHEKAGTPLTPAQRAALDALDGVLNLPGLRAEFTLQPGEMFFINNRWLLHNRTAFTDHDDPRQRRHLIRLWLRAAVGRDPV